MFVNMNMLVHLVITSLNLITCYHTLQNNVKYQMKYKSHSGSTADMLFSNGGAFKHLTCWTQFIHTMIFGLILITDFIDNSFVIEISHLFFNGLALPFGLFVSTSYWSLYAIDRELIAPKEIERFEPQWKLFIIHTLPLISVLLDINLSDHTSGQNCLELLLMFTVSLMYLATIFFLGFYRNDWSYPFLSKMNLQSRIFFAIASLIIGPIYYYLGQFMCKLAWY